MAELESILTIVDCIKVCHEGYRAISSFIRALNEMGHDVAELQQRFKEEECRMWTFALARNLAIDHGQPTAAVRANLPHFWVEVVDTRFALVKKHLGEAEQLVCRYSGSARVSGTEASGVKATERTARDILSTAENPGDAKGVPSYNLDRRPTDSPSILTAERALENHSNILQESSLRLKLRWSLQDKKLLDKTVEKLSADNDALWKLIEPNHMNMMVDAVSSQMSAADFKLFTARISSSSSCDQTDVGKRGYEQRIQEQGQAREYIALLDQETMSQKMSRSLDISSFPNVWQSQLPDKRSRMLTNVVFHGTEEEALVEWKEWNPSLITRDEVIARVSDIVAILSSPPKFVTSILTSPGFFEDSRSNSRGTKWIGIVYDTTSLGCKPRIRTLRDLITRPQGKFTEAWKPPLGDRFKLAHRLPEILLEIHNCGWFHKGLRPENIVFFSSEKSVRNPYLLGWDSSRSSKRGQKTEPVICRHKDFELYQHPQWFEEPSPEDNDQSRFRIEFDHYQLGCLLLEIGLWCLIGDLKQATYQTFLGPDWRDDWKRYLEHKTESLEIEMGKIYSGVILNLLRGLNTSGNGLEYWNAVVRQLSELKA